MTTHAYTEDQLVEQPAIALFAELGWQTVSAMEEVFGQGGTLGRETSGEAVLTPRLRAALEKLNPHLPAEAITSAMDELTRDRSAMSLAAATREMLGLLKDGVKVLVPERERGGLKDERVQVVDWERSGARAKVRIEIEDTLEDLPKAYSDELFRTKCNVVFEHVYEAYMGDAASVYSGAA